MDIAVKYKGGGSFIKLKPTFSTNGEKIFISCKNSIMEYNVKTGKLIHEYKGMVKNIIGFTCNLIDGIDCLIACSEEGQVIVWKTVFKIKILEKIIKCTAIQHFYLISYDLTSGLEALIVMPGKKTQSILFRKHNIEKKTVSKSLLKVKKNIKYSMDVSGNKFFAVIFRNVIMFVNLEMGRYKRYEMARDNRTFTCIACHPCEEIVLTGDDTGRIVLWKNIFLEPVQSVFHWHTLPVNALVFSSHGSNFYSGADECVLVKWQKDNPNTKQYLPRLAAGISHIVLSNNNAYIAVATNDNAIRIIDSRLNQISLIQHLVLGKQFDSGIVYDPTTKALVLNGNVGCIQFLLPNDMSLLYNVDIVGQNKLTDERECKIENTEIRKFAISKSGKWLATVEDRKINKTVLDELRLKFWNFNSQKQMFELNTCIEFPHGKGINSIAFQPLMKESNLKCVTIGNDKKFKIWQLTEVLRINKLLLIWKCWSIRCYRLQFCKSLSFSVDGSLFATAFDSILTTWTPDSCDLKCSLVHSLYTEQIEHVQFAQGNQCHLIVTASKRHICVWNLLTLCMSWVVKLEPINLLIADPLATNMVAICDNKVYVFEPASPTVIYSSSELLPKNKKITAATFIPGKYSNDSRLKWYERSNLYFFTSKNELYCISKSEEPVEYEEYIEDLSEDLSVFSKLKPITATNLSQNNYHKNHLFEKDVGLKTLKEYLDTPIHTLRPIRLEAKNILKSFVLQKDSVNLDMFK